MLGKRIRHIHRYQEIINAFLRNGFSYVVRDLGLIEMFSIKKKWASEEEDAQTRSLGEKIRRFLEDLGSSFIKLGQIASTRPDLLPADIIKELEKLQDAVQPFSFAQVQEIVESELGNTLQHVFNQFDEEPLAAGSIGQVHYAVLHNERPVAVKVQRPNLQSIIETDLEIITDLSRMAENRFAWARKYQLVDIVGELSKTLRKELDYESEGRAAEKIARHFHEDKHVVIPNVYWEYTTKKVLTTDFIDGVKLNDIERLDRFGYDRKKIAERFTHMMLKQILLDGYFHADPHPGNIFILPNETIVMIDFGMVGRLNAHIKYHFASLVIAMIRRNINGIIRAIDQLGLIPAEIDLHELKKDIEDLLDKYYEVPISQVRFGNALQDLFSIAFHYQISFPTDLTLLGKTLLTMEGIVEKLDPDFNMIGVAEPFGEKLLKERYHPKNITERLWMTATEYADIFLSLPQNIRSVSAFMKEGKLRLEITAPQFDRLLTKLDKIGNRLSYSIVLLSFSIIMVGLIIGSSIAQESTVIWRIPVIEIGFIIATIMVIWLLYSIMRSGRL